MFAENATGISFPNSLTPDAVSIKFQPGQTKDFPELFDGVQTGGNLGALLTIQASEKVQPAQLDGTMSLANVAIEYRIIVRYASDVPESELDNLANTMDRDRMPDRLLDTLYAVIQRFPGLLIEIYEDHSEAPVASAITPPVLRRTGS
jgi:hypothetical protein